MTESYIQYDSNGDARSFVGRAAVEVFRAATLVSAMKLYRATKMLPNRMYTPTNMLATAGAIVGKRYRRGEMELAIRELGEWVKTAKAALPAKEG